MIHPMFQLSEHRSLQRQSSILGIWNVLEVIGTVPQEVTFWPPGLETLSWDNRSSRNLTCCCAISASRQHSRQLPPTEISLFEMFLERNPLPCWYNYDSLHSVQFTITPQFKMLNTTCSDNLQGFYFNCQDHYIICNAQYTFAFVTTVSTQHNIQ